MNQQERNEEIEYWWEGAESTVELPQKEYNRLRAAFFEVLAKIPEEDFENFLGEQPNIFCCECLGRAFSYTVAVPRSPSVPNSLRVNGIYLESKITKRKRLLDYLAHEIAHIVRHDHREHNDPDAEKKADDLSESWGFKRIYKKKNP